MRAFRPPHPHHPPPPRASPGLTGKVAPPIAPASSTKLLGNMDRKGPTARPHTSVGCRPTFDSCKSTRAEGPTHRLASRPAPGPRVGTACPASHAFIPAELSKNILRIPLPDTPPPPKSFSFCLSLSFSRPQRPALRPTFPRIPPRPLCPKLHYTQRPLASEFWILTAGF